MTNLLELLKTKKNGKCLLARNQVNLRRTGKCCITILWKDADMLMSERRKSAAENLVLIVKLNPFQITANEKEEIGIEMANANATLDEKMRHV